MDDLYKTIQQPSDEVLFKDRGSKFMAYAFPVETEEEVKKYLETVKQEHHKARHWCYAWRLGVEQSRYRVNDDGEPSNSAGQPIYGQILSFDVTNIFIVVVRYFSGVKLGVGGLINAYRSAAKLALDHSQIVERTIKIKYEITCSYEHLNRVLRLIKEQRVEIVNQTMTLDCVIHVLVRKKEAEQFKQQVLQLRIATITIQN